MESCPVRLSPDPTADAASVLVPGARVVVRDAAWIVNGVQQDDGDALVDLVSADGHASARTLLPHVEQIVAGPDALRRVTRRRARRVWLSLRASACAPCRPLSPIGLDLAIVDYQLAPLMALLGGEVRRVLVADAVGLGKTIEAGLAMREAWLRRGRLRSLVLCPSTLVAQWLDELRGKLRLAATACDAQWLARQGAALPPGMNPWSVEACFVASLDFIKQPHVLDGASRVGWDVVVVDEAHHVTRHTYRSSAADTLGKAAEWLLLLTATPHDGHDDTFARLLGTGHLNAAGQPALADPVMFFRRTHDRLGVTRRRRTRALTVRLSEAETRLFAALDDYIASVLAPSPVGHALLLAGVLRRRACSSAAALVRTVDRRLRLLEERGGAHPDPAQGSLFARAVSDEPDDDDPDVVIGATSGASWPRERAWLSRLRLAGLAAMRYDRKRTVLRRYVARTAPEPIVAFTEYRDTLVAYARALSPWVQLAAMSGATPQAERTSALREFHEGRARLLITTDIAAEGLNLQHRSRLVVHLDLPWTPSRLEQRAGRVDRFGQPRDVHVLSLVRAHAAGSAQVEQLRERHGAAEAAQACGYGAVASARLVDRMDCPDRLEAASRVVAHDLEGQRLAERQLARERVRQAPRTWCEQAPPARPVFARRSASGAGVPYFAGRSSTRRSGRQETCAVVETVVRRTDGYLVSRLASAERRASGDPAPVLRASVEATAPAEPPQSTARRVAIAARLRRRAHEALRQPGLFGTPGAGEGANSGKAITQAPADTERGGTTTVTTRLVVTLPPRDRWR